AEAIEAITETVLDALRKAKPDKAVVELGLDLALESGALTALIVKGKGSAALTITLEWTSGQSGADG
ncbi:MAG: CU044_2847 family protein, partial [Gaiellaceae bacterium]